VFDGQNLAVMIGHHQGHDAGIVQGVLDQAIHLAPGCPGGEVVDPGPGQLISGEGRCLLQQASGPQSKDPIPGLIQVLRAQGDRTVLPGDHRGQPPGAQALGLGPLSPLLGKGGELHVHFGLAGSQSGCLGGTPARPTYPLHLGLDVDPPGRPSPQLGLLESHDLPVAVLIRLTPADPQLRCSVVELGPVDGLRPGLVGKQPTRVNRRPPTILSPSDIQDDAVFVQVWLGLPGGLVGEAGYDQLGSHVAITAPVAPSGGPARVLQASPAATAWSWTLRSAARVSSSG